MQIHIFAPNEKKLIPVKEGIKNVTTGIYLDTRRPMKDGRFPVKLRVTYKRKTKLYSTTYSLSVADFKKALGDKPRGIYKDYSLRFNAVEARAVNTIKNLSFFSFDFFMASYISGNISHGDVFVSYEKIISEFNEEGKIGNRDIFTDAQKSIKKFHGKSNLSFAEVTPRFLKRYERWMVEKEDNSLTSVSIYTRTIRRLYNLAISRKEAKEENYPFGRDIDLYRIPNPGKQKKALPKSQIKKLFFNKSIEGSPEHFYSDLWLFTYLCNGINMNDICRLKYRDIDGDTIFFRRRKTEYTNRSSKPIEAVITKKVQSIIKRWGNKPPLHDKYIFPFLSDGSTPREIRNKVKQATKQVNTYIKRVASDVGIECNITTGTARHSFATVLKQAKVPVAHISDAMGHSNISTTEIYLGSFEKEEKRKIAKHLTDF